MTKPKERLVARLLEVEEAIQRAPATCGPGPYDVNPELGRLALEEAELLERLGTANDQGL
jgi:hypothetical protein